MALIFQEALEADKEHEKFMADYAKYRKEADHRDQELLERLKGLEKHAIQANENDNILF